ncbi:MAG: radical SAM protein [Phaeospirillum sp.]|nr:radical SAM protein [Phaeospirillum sp.]
MASPIQKLRHFAYNSSLLWKNRGVLPMVVSGYAKALLLKKPVLRSLEFAITANCNVNCSMCYATKIQDKKRQLLSPAEYGEIYAQARELGCFTVHLSGGEPTLRKDLPEILANLMPGRTIISMTTNSTLLEPTYLETLRKGGLSVLHYSLNSVDPVVNDQERDFKGHHERIMQQLAVAKSLDYEVCLSIVIAHGKLDEMRRLTEFASAKGIGVVYSLATPAGNWTGATEQLLTPEEWTEVDAYMAANAHVRSDWTINLTMTKGCPAGFEKIALSPYGDVQGCAMSFISHGNVREERLEPIWRRMMEFEPFRKRSDKCLIGLDRDYIDEYLLPVNSANILPVPIERHPVHPLIRDGG